MLVFGGDVEGHLGKDNQFYMLDFSRVLPPVRPPFLPPLPFLGEEEEGEEEVQRRKKMWVNSHLYLLFRSEFLKRYQHPLCSDGYSLFVVSDPLRFVVAILLLSFFLLLLFPTSSHQPPSSLLPSKKTEKNMTKTSMQQQQNY